MEWQKIDTIMAHDSCDNVLVIYIHSVCINVNVVWSIEASASRRKTFAHDGFGHLIYKIPENSKNILFYGTNSQKL